MAVTSDAGSDDTYALEDVIQVTLTFSEAVDVTGSPQLKIKMDPAYGEEWAAYASGTGSTTLAFAYTVASANLSTQGIAVLADTLALNGGTIQSTAADADADLSHAGLAHDADHKVDGRTTPTVTAVSITSDPGDDDTYRLDDVIEVTVTFSEAVDVDTTGGSPRLTIKMDPDYGEKQASYASGSGSTGLTFTFTVVEPNFSDEGIAVLVDTLQLNGGSIQSTAADVNADLSHSGLAHDDDHKVDWEQASAPPATTPTVTAVAITSDPGADDTYSLGDVIRVTVTFSEGVDVTGSPRLNIDMDPADWGTKQVAYASGSGSTKLVFTHTVVEPNISTQGIAVLANTLALNGGTIQSDGLDAQLAHAGLAHNGSHKVDWEG